MIATQREKIIRFPMNYEMILFIMLSLNKFFLNIELILGKLFFIFLYNFKNLFIINKF